jgi:hypothetical protein
MDRDSKGARSIQMTDDPELPERLPPRRDALPRITGFFVILAVFWWFGSFLVEGSASVLRGLLASQNGKARLDMIAKSLAEGIQPITSCLAWRRTAVQPA